MNMAPSSEEDSYSKEGGSRDELAFEDEEESVSEPFGNLQTALNQFLQEAPASATTESHRVSERRTVTEPNEPLASIHLLTEASEPDSGHKKTMKLNIFDTGSIHAVTSAHYRNAMGAIICFDLSRRETFLNLESWVS